MNCSILEVEWLITDPIEMENDHFFAQQTITPIDHHRWNQIKETYLEISQNYQNISVSRKRPDSKYYFT